MNKWMTDERFWEDCYVAVSNQLSLLISYLYWLRYCVLPVVSLLDFHLFLGFADDILDICIFSCMEKYSGKDMITRHRSSNNRQVIYYENVEVFCSPLPLQPLSGLFMLTFQFSH